MPLQNLRQTFDRVRLVPSLHALCFTPNDVKQWCVVARALEALAVAELILGLGYFRGQVPAAGPADRFSVLDVSLFRPEHTKGRR